MLSLFPAKLSSAQPTPYGPPIQGTDGAATSFRSPAQDEPRSLGDLGNVAIMEVGAGFDLAYLYGSPNPAPLREIVRRYFKTHADLDFLVLLTDFGKVPEPSAKGFYQQVKNEVRGIGLPIFDNSSQYGSTGRLQGIVELGNVAALAEAPFGPPLAEAVASLSHEVLHRFAAFVRFRAPEGGMSDALLGSHAAHWSNLFNSGGSLMYGNLWRDNGDGTFTSAGSLTGYGPLDLYLMGALPKEEVPPMLLIENPLLDKTRFSKPGETVSGVARWVTIDDIIAAEGARVPDAAQSQKIFSVGFLLLVRSGEPAAGTVAAVELLRSAFAGHFARLTRGAAGIAGVAPSLQVGLDSPQAGCNLVGPDLAVSGTIVNSAGTETTVKVNGLPAQVIGERFVARGVQLHPGLNTVQVSAYDKYGLSATVTRTVNSCAGHYLRLVPSVTAGHDPLSVQLELAGSFLVASAQVTLSGPARGRLFQEPGSATISALLGVQGTYTISASALAPDGKTCSDSVTITVLPK